MNFTKIWFTTIIILLFSFQGIAQHGTIRGIISEEGSGEPILFTNVFLRGTQYGATTDANGYFIINKITPGDYELVVRALGYDSLVEPVSVKANEFVTKKLHVSKATYMLETVSIKADKEIAKTETRTSVQYVTPKQMKQMPTIGGTADLAQYLQVLPGVVFTGDQGGQLYIRGGSPIQNKVLLDGAIIYNPFHSIGLFSVFDTDIMRSADIYTGGYNSEFGGRISSIMDIKTRDGNMKRTGGKIEANTFGAKLLIEGPFKKYNPETGNSASYIFSAKNSYLAQSSKFLYQYIDTAGLPFNFMDFYGKVSFNTSNGSKFNLFGFSFNDNVNYENIAEFDWKSAGGGLSFVLVPEQSAMIMDGIFAYSNYKIGVVDMENNPRSSEINGFNIGLGFNYIMGKNNFKYGLEMLGFMTDFNFTNSSNLIIQQQDNTTELATYVKYKRNFSEKFILEPGFRLQYYASLNNVSAEPRLAMKYNLTENTRFKMAAGMYSQNLISAVSDRDVVNLFYGFLSGPDNLPEHSFDGREITHKLQKANHLVVGVEHDINQYITVNLEAYIKDFRQLTNINKRKVFEDADPYNNRRDTANYKPDYLRKDFIVETGSAKGIDFNAKFQKGRYYLWTVYSLGWVNRNDGIVKYVTHFDRRHNVNFVFSTNWGKFAQWQFDLRWNYGSGFAFAQNIGIYPNITGSTGIDDDFISGNENLGFIYDETNSGRLPDYHRLDINFKYKFIFSEFSNLEINLGATNLYNRANIFYYNRNTNERVNQLPLMPSLGVSWTF
ncbi:MAG: TonB-dependent receptor [Bacteroidales bacterium]|jgi:hypothetical protein|nr:TonB-dependent receptor [Bacteroidales bacterium]